MRTPVSALGLAFLRVGRGLLGGWCVIGPLLLVFAYSELAGDALAMVAIIAIVLACYLIAILNLRSQGLRFVKVVGKDTLLMIGFSGIAGVLEAVFGLRSAGSSVFILLFVIAAFWMLEAVRRDKIGNA